MSRAERAIASVAGADGEAAAWTVIGMIRKEKHVQDDPAFPRTLRGSAASSPPEVWCIERVEWFQMSEGRSGLRVFFLRLFSFCMEDGTSSFVQVAVCCSRRCCGVEKLSSAFISELQFPSGDHLGSPLTREPRKYPTGASSVDGESCDPHSRTDLMVDISTREVFKCYSHSTADGCGQ